LKSASQEPIVRNPLELIEGWVDRIAENGARIE